MFMIHQFVFIRFLFCSSKYGLHVIRIPEDLIARASLRTLSRYPLLIAVHNLKHGISPVWTEFVARTLPDLGSRLPSSALMAPVLSRGPGAGMLLPPTRRGECLGEEKLRLSVFADEAVVRRTVRVFRIRIFKNCRSDTILEIKKINFT